MSNKLKKRRGETKTMRDEKRRRVIVWEWAVPLMSVLLALLLVEVGHLSEKLLGRWRWLLVLVGWAVLWESYTRMWLRWRSCEIARVRRGGVSLGRPRISLIVGQDLYTGQAVVVDDRGFVVTCDRPSDLPPPARLAKVTDVVGPDVEIELDGLEGP